MRCIRSLLLGAAIVAVLWLPAAAEPTPPPKPSPVVGMYVHQHWPYNHPYAARTWTIEDWRGYLDGLHRLGFNTLVIWPMLETMPDPLTPSDRENIEKIANVIRIAHADFQMPVYLVISPNVMPDSAAAGQSTFQDRHFFHCDFRINPADADAVALMMKQRARLLEPLAAMDGLFIIDSDPGGYPGSTNPEFVNLLAQHRKLLDRLRPGIELVYWMWAGWPAYARFYETGEFAWGKPEEFEEAIELIEAAGLEPWGIACTQERARQLGRADRVLMFQYGAIEGEPTMPLTNFGGEQAHTFGRPGGLRGVLGNSQTHCVQLPNLLAFARGAAGKPLPKDADYVAFANDLILGRGAAIVSGWEALAGTDPVVMRAQADQLEQIAAQPLTTGPLKGLLFGDPARFMQDLVLQLRYQAAFRDVVAAAQAKVNPAEPLQVYLTALEAWYARHGYRNTWVWQAGDLNHLDNQDINAVLVPRLMANTPFGRVAENYYLGESFTPRLIEAIRRAIRDHTPATQAAP